MVISQSWYYISNRSGVMADIFVSHKIVLIIIAEVCACSFDISAAGN